jgi:hypothetical protein
MISFLIYVYLLLFLYDRQFNHHLSLPPLIVSSFINTASISRLSQAADGFLEHPPDLARLWLVNRRAGGRAVWEYWRVVANTHLRFR